LTSQVGSTHNQPSFLLAQHKTFITFLKTHVASKDGHFPN